MKRIGAAILGAFDGAIIFIFFQILENGGLDNFTISTGPVIFGSIIGAVICYFYPFASIAIFAGLFVSFLKLCTRDTRDRR